MSRIQTFPINYRYLASHLKRCGFVKRGTGAGEKTHADFARMCGISPGYLCEILKGDKQPSMRVLRRMSFHLCISLDVLMNPDHELLGMGFSHVIARWVVDQMDPEMTADIDVMTALEILKRLREERGAQACTQGDVSVFSPGGTDALKGD